MMRVVAKPEECIESGHSLGRLKRQAYTHQPKMVGSSYRLVDGRPIRAEDDWETLIREFRRREEASQHHISSYILFKTKDKAKVESDFYELLLKWRNDVRLLSSVAKMAVHPAYQSIIGMGWLVVPLLLKELEREPDHLFWALSAITRENPIKPEDAGNIGRMAKAWIDWGRERGLL
jgi:hypothetical protein